MSYHVSLFKHAFLVTLNIGTSRPGQRMPVCKSSSDVTEYGSTLFALHTVVFGPVSRFSKMVLFKV